MAKKKQTIDNILEPDSLPDIICDRSILQIYSECPHQANLMREHNRPVNSPLATGGTIIHKLIEEAFDYAEETQGGMDVVADYFVQEVPKTRPDLQPDILNAAKFVANYLLRINRAAIMGYEKQIAHVLFPATISRGAVKATACLDLMLYGEFDSIEVWDWKSGWKQRTNTDARTDFQAQMIAWLIWKNVPDCLEVKFVFIETRTGGKAEFSFWRNRYMDGKRTLTQEMAFESRISEAVRLFLTQADDAYPSPDKCCNCDYSDLCKYCSWECKEIADDPANFLNVYQVCEEVQKNRHKQITAWLKAGKPLSSGEMKAEVTTKPSKFTWKILGDTE